MSTPKRGKKPLKPKPEKWECKEGCDVTTRICSHLERTLPSMRDGKVQLAGLCAALSTVDAFNVFRPSFSLRDFESTMRSYGFTDSWDIELLTSRYFYGMSYRSIADDQNYVAYKTVERRLKELHKLLKERGYGKKK